MDKIGTPDNVHLGQLSRQSCVNSHRLVFLFAATVACYFFVYCGYPICTMHEDGDGFGANVG